MQIIQWAHANRGAEQLVPGEIRTVAVSLSPDQPSSATVRVVQRSTGAELVATQAATVAGSIVSYLLTVPAITPATIDVQFLATIGTEVYGVTVRAEVVAR
jgi:hypothetical protein